MNRARLIVAAVAASAALIAPAAAAAQTPPMPSQAMLAPYQQRIAAIDAQIQINMLNTSDQQAMVQLQGLLRQRADATAMLSNVISRMAAAQDQVIRNIR
jgi:hypothetical protein